MKKIDIVHVYAGTSGVAGLYLHPIYEGLNNDYRQEVFVSYYYPFNYGKKIYYKFSDLCISNKYKLHGKLRLIVRIFELIYVICRILLYLVFNKVRIINYSLNTTLGLEVAFLRLIKFFFNTKIYITCHEVIPFSSSMKDKEHVLKKRKVIFSLADKLVVHNNHSRHELEEFFNIHQRKIIYYPFPVMDMNDMYPTQQAKNIQNVRKFVFFCNYRKEKGLDILVNAWIQFQEKCNDKNISLNIAGLIPKSEENAIQKLHCKSIFIRNEFLSDDDYYKLMLNSDCIVLPYTHGTNSGIPSSAFSLGKLVIASDIELFKSSPLMQPEFLFESGNADSLSQALLKLYNITENEISNVLHKTTQSMLKYNEDFKNKLIEVYNHKN